MKEDNIKVLMINEVVPSDRENDFYSGYNDSEYANSIINQKNNSVSFILCEKLLRKDYQSHISLTFDDEKKYIEYYHNKPTFPFVKSMASIWYFVDESNAISHFYIIRRFDLKNRFVKYFLFWLVKKIINKHVADYYEQLIVLSKAITINSFINNK